MSTSVHADPALVSELLDEIESVTLGPSWSLATEHVLNVVGARVEEYARFLYGRREGDVPEDTFNENNVELLVEFLASRGFSSAALEFECAGVFLSSKVLLDWLEFFQSVTISRLLSRDVDREMLDTAVAGCREFADAAEFYCRALFDPAELKTLAVTGFLVRRHLPDHALSRGILLRFLEEQFRLRVLRWEDLEQALYDALYDRACTWGFAVGARRGLADLPQAVLAALRELEFTGQRMPAPEQLRKRYRNLLRKHHPDLNAQGLERTRNLIEAYGVLMRALQGQQGNS